MAVVGLERPALRWHVVAILATVSASALVLALTPSGSTGARNFSYLAQTAVAVYAGIAAAIAAGRLTAELRIAWTAIAVAMLGVAVTIGAPAVAVVLLGASPASTDAFAYAQIVSFAAGLLGAAALIATYVAKHARLRTVVDALISTAATYMIAWLTFVVTVAATIHDDAARLALMQLLAYVASGVVLTFVVVKLRPDDRRPLIFLIAALITGMTYALLELTVPAYHFGLVGQPIDCLAIIGPLCVVLASATIMAPVVDPAEEPGGTKPYVSVIPYVAVVVTALAIADATLRGRVDTFLLWNGVCVMVLISFHQYLALGENERLTRTVAQRSRDLVRSEDRFRQLVENSSDIITIVNPDGTVQSLSQAARHLLGLVPADLEGQSLLTIVHPEDQLMVMARLEVVAHDADSRTPFLFRIKNASGGWRMLEAVPTNLLNVDSVSGIVLNTRDVTERQALEDQLNRQSLEDPLTQLVNRTVLHDRLRHALARRAHEPGIVALIVVDLDDFKTINDSLGHQIGDEVLISVANRAAACLRDSDTAARLGGDEFAFLLDTNVTEASAITVAQRILQAVEEPIIAGEDLITIHATAGITLSDEHVSAEDLLRRADVAMYRAKVAGKRGYSLFDDAMDKQAHARLRLHQSLTAALERHEFFLQYQPVFSLHTPTVEGVEALVRWRHPERGLVPPNDFIGAAEETGLIVPLSHWILTEAFRQAKTWNERWGAKSPLTMNVNISARHLQMPEFVDDILRVIRDVGVDPTTIVLELTESAIIDDLHGSIRRLRAVKELGLRVALDDFGTGYSSFGYLRDLPVDILKIDRSFVMELGAQADRSEIVRAIQAVSTSLKLETVAEGVEEPEQLSELRRLNVDHAQGYYFARPADAGVIDELFEEWIGRNNMPSTLLQPDADKTVPAT